MKRILFTGALALGAATAAGAAQPTLKNYDAFWATQKKTAYAQLLQTKAARTDRHYDAQLGGSTFVWADRVASAPTVALGASNRRGQLETFARQFLRKQAGHLAIKSSSVETAVLTDLQDLGHGPVIARFRQKVGGVEVFNREVNVMLDRSGRPVAASGYFATSDDVRSPQAFAGDAAKTAIVKAFAQLGVSVSSGLLQKNETQGDYGLFSLNTILSNFAITRQPRVKKVYYAKQDKLVPAYYVELFGRYADKSGTTAWSFVIGADGSKLFAKDLVAYDNAPFSYRVFADSDGIHQPFDAPLGNGYVPFPGSAVGEELTRTSATANLVTLVSGPISTADPWLADDATTTTGNNADAFLDTGPQLAIPLNLPDPIGTLTGDGYIPYSGDLRVALTGDRTFDYAIAADDDPSTDSAKNAAIVNLFYMNNWLHDWWYDHGFNEAAGNAQDDNYGRGGEEGDAISAQGQDSSGRNNANMATPADGGSPTMQMYLFDGPLSGEVSVTEPTGLDPFKFTGASFGPNTFDVSGEIALANDAVGEPADGCAGDVSVPITGTTIPAPPQPSLLGKIAIVDRGTCSFTTKEQFATLSGAKALVVVNNADGNPITMGNADIPISIGITTDQLYVLPAVMISKADGQKLKDLVAAGTSVTMHVERDPSIDYDGTMDEMVISHEFFHHVSNRLVGNGSGLSNTQGGGMGEGWSDVDSLLLVVRPEDVSAGSATYPNDHWQGAYPTGFYVIPDYYFGIRRAPYSTRMDVNPLTFKHITEGVPIEGAPVSFGADGTNNSEVHDVGEVWANMLWEVYAALLNHHDFDTAQSRMKDYVIAGLKMTPSSPTFTEARDGVLAAALATDPADYALAARAFAKRGMGVDAVSPDRSSTTNDGVVESYVAFEAPLPTLKAGIGSVAEGFDDCDHDGVLDAGETGLLTFSLFNNGAYTPGDTVTVSVASTNGELTLAGGTLSFVAPAIGETADASITATLASTAASPLSVGLTLTVEPPATDDGSVLYPDPGTVTLLTNYDIAKTATSDDFEYPTIAASGWTRSSTGTTSQWDIVDDNDDLGTGKIWYAPDPESTSDLYLVTPAFSVPSDATLSISFDHHYDFESLLPIPYIGTGWDGGMVEVSTDGGATWTEVTDFGASFTQNGYNGTAQVFSHRAFVNSNSGMQTSVLDFAKLLAGQTAQLRFHVGADEVNGGYGWAVDNVAMTGTSGPVFNSVSADDGECLTPGGTTGGSTTGGGTGATDATAALTATPTSGDIPLQVAFDASTSAGADGAAITQYTFVFGDGSDPVTTTSPTLSYTYTAAGTFEAEVVVTDADGHTAESSIVTIKPTTTIVVGGSDHPVAALVVTPTSGTAPLNVSFDGSRSFSSDGASITGYRWNFGDGSAVVTTTRPTTTHVYTQVGTFTPSLTVTDSEGSSSDAVVAQVKTVAAGGGGGTTTGGTGGGGSGSGGGSGGASNSGNNGGAMGLGSVLALGAAALLRRRKPGLRRGR
ncbi:M36 family metallopeptidase [Solimonas marina]|uniref:PKD domain-containing protein n=1 Tax=Solimonas marina TaxID=2714601 RepID=A0A969W749_9GAMM|nr:M36 family metallopeptidase [Solimonas marina]NKF21911.1 PKD domain-containing protein [Solimonas marina]